MPIQFKRNELTNLRSGAVPFDARFNYQRGMIRSKITIVFAFGDVIRHAVSPSPSPSSIGGDANTIWYCDFSVDRIYELSTTDFSAIRYGGTPSVTGEGIGGDANTIWHCDNYTDLAYELSTTDFSVIRAGNTPATYARCIGGDANTIWHCDPIIDRIYELSTTDFSAIRYTSSSLYATPADIGGDANTIWFTTSLLTYELSITDLSMIRSAESDYWDEGDPTAGTTTTLTDATKNWEVDQWKGGYVFVENGGYQEREVKSNTATVITVTEPFDFIPSETDYYEVLNGVALVGIGGDQNTIWGTGGSGYIDYPRAVCEIATGS